MGSGGLRASRLREAGEKRGEARLAGVLLHGRGLTAEDKIDLAARLGSMPGIRWVVPVADTPGSWYPGRFWDSSEVNEPFLTRAVERCHEAVEEAGEAGRVGPERIVIIGFSQGACVAVEYALRHPGRCGALIVFTGALMGPAGPDWKAGKPSLDGLRVLLTGSDVDEWVPEENVREAARALTDLGADVRLRVYKGRPHIVSEEEIVEAREFLASC